MCRKDVDPGGDTVRSVVAPSQPVPPGLRLEQGQFRVTPLLHRVLHQSHPGHVQRHLQPIRVLLAKQGPY